MTTANLIEIFCILDEFCKYFTPELKKHLVDTSDKRRRNHPCCLLKTDDIHPPKSVISVHFFCLTCLMALQI